MSREPAPNEHGGGAPVARIALLDLWRSLAVFMMAAYHVIYDLALFSIVADSVPESLPAQLLRCATALSFVIISGAASRLSASNARRGLKLLCAALALGAVSRILKMPIRFGILHLLASCVLLYSLWERLGFAAPSPRAAAVCAPLFALSALLLQNCRVSTELLYPIGLRSAEFFSADYYPLLPWGFAFVIGLALGGELRARAEEGALPSPHIPAALSFTARHSLAIYLLHQPLIIGLIYLLRGV